jgi:sarcosine oxidase subunit alpha
MSQTFRTAAGGRIRRDRPAAFQFDGQNLQGFEGDTLASALLANDVHLVGRSFKYHRPRGIASAGSEEPNALVTVDRGPGRVTPNLRATQVELYDGLKATSQNRFPSLRFDLGSVAGMASPLLGAGFYYKTFMWPPSFWRRVYEPAIRAAAGLGRAPVDPDPDCYAQQYAHCDVLVIGGGPAGLAAALAASAAGARVIVCDEHAEFGGSLLAEESATIDGLDAAEWLAESLAILGDSVTLLSRTTAFGCYPDNLIGLVQRVTDHIAEPAENAPRERLWQVRAQRVVLAAGAIQRPLVFPNNDRPGIMLADAGRVYLQRYGVRVGSHVVVATADDSAYRTALALHAAGIDIAAVVDQRASGNEDLHASVRAAGIPVHLATSVTSTEGRLRVHTAKLAGVVRVLPCDTILTSGGWTPSVHLFAQARGRLRFDVGLGAFLPAAPVAGMYVAGACAGTFGLAACLEEGYAAGTAASRPGGIARGFAVTGAASVNAAPVYPANLPMPGGPHSKAFVDLQNDVTTKDLATATQEGFRSIEHIKRYTTTGMATDQGKTSNLNALAAVADLLQQPVPAIGLTTYRPPYTPVTFGSLAGAARGQLFDPLRTAPLHDWADRHGALFEDVGNWRRARCFPRAGETLPQAIARECQAVRTAVGLFDASTLGKIEVAGPDAGTFLDRLYTGNFSRLVIGRCRYAVLLGEDGFVRDDGVIARLAQDRFHVTTTTGGAASVLHHMEDYLQTEFTDLRVWLTSTTEQWAVIALQGPRAFEVLAPLTEDIVWPAMPHMSVGEGQVAGTPARIFRMSFTGETGFEINVPADHAQHVWGALLAAGEPMGITPYGTEAMHVLRAEVGYIIVGQETDGTVTPDDLGLGWTIGRSKTDFVGKRSLARPDMRRADRKQLVGLLTTDPKIVLEEGAQLVATPTPTVPAVMLGHVTSSYWSETLGRSIALALLSGGRGRMGSILHVPMPGRTIAVQVTAPIFLPSPAGAKTGGKDAVFNVDTVAAGTQMQPPEPPARTHPLQALAAVSPPCPHAQLAALTPITRLLVRADNVAATAIGRALGVLLGTAPNRAVVSFDRAALWLGPDEWLVLAAENDADLARRATLGLGSIPGSVVDVGHRSCSIELVGRYAAWCLNAFCALDLDISAFPVGMATRTLFGKAEIVLWRTDPEAFHVEVARSFAPYVWNCLEEARRELLDMPEA